VSTVSSTATEIRDWHLIPQSGDGQASFCGKREIASDEDRGTTPK